MIVLLEIKNLYVHYATSEGTVKAVTNVQFEIAENEVFGLIGESGCGKSTISKAIMRLLPKNASIPKGEIFFEGENVTSMSDSEMRSIRGKEIALVTQSAMNSLNPVYKVGNQLIEAIQAHKRIAKSEARRKVIELFELVGLELGLIESYPHEFSGGMKQRSIIAMALSLNPKLIIMDEPTTGLDVLVQYRILEKISEILEQIRSSILLITHDISIVAQMCNRIAVMYGGQLMEIGKTEEVFYNPSHPYSIGLLNAFPNLLKLEKDLISIPGSPPSLIDDMPGCPFQERCPFQTQRCSQKIEMHKMTETHWSSCHLYYQTDEFRKNSSRKETWSS